MGELSFAEQQSVEVAKAIGQQAELLIMDEPTSALSDRESERLFRIIGDLKQRGVAVIYISHRMEEIFRLADTITVMRDGRRVATRPAGEFDETRLISLMVGRDFDSALVRQPAAAGEVALAVRGLAREGRFREISFELRAGEILGLAGLIGRGPHGDRERHLRAGSGDLGRDSRPWAGGADRLPRRCSGARHRHGHGGSQALRLRAGHERAGERHAEQPAPLLRGAVRARAGGRRGGGPADPRLLHTRRPAANSR